MDIIDTNLEQKLYDILTLLQQYREANQYGESLKEYSESLEKQKKLKHIQEGMSSSCTRLPNSSD